MSQNHTSPQALEIHPGDDVAVALADLAAGDEVLGVTLKDAIPAGHKFALHSLGEGQDVCKYGFPIGHATQAIRPGEWVHTQNLFTNLEGQLAYTYQPVRYPQPSPQAATFQGYRREDGQVGIRNEIWIIGTVGCVSGIAQALAETGTIAYGAQVPDGIHAFPHPYGCSQMGEDHERTQQVLAAMVRHPNAGGVLVLGLGCENNHLDSFRELLGEVDPRRVKFLNTQDVEDEIEVGLSLLSELARYVAGQKREPACADALIVGLKCGGSDGFSGITANPLLGRFSDLLIAAGGATVLTEVPEMFGAETLLMNRAESQRVFQQTVELINGFKAYYQRHGQVVYENPSPGNKKGGITTLEDKSLGCTQKGGTSPVVDVLPYGGRVQKRGLNLLAGPGNDICAVTDLMAAGCQLILFTTGRGTPLGAPVPTLKVATHSALARRKPHWIDFDAGRLLEGADFSTLTQALLEQVLEVASGSSTCNERNHYREIAIWKDGVTL